MWPPRMAAISGEFAAEQSGDPLTLENNWRAWTVSHEQAEHVRQRWRLAHKVRAGGCTAFVHVGIGGSDLGRECAMKCRTTRATMS